MDSLSQRDEHESCAKRLKLDLSEIKNSGLCDGSGFSEFSAFREEHLDAAEGPSPDCDSGYDASTMESAPTPFNITSPHTDTCDTTGDTHESLSEIADPDLEDDNVSTVGNLSDLSGLSDLPGQELKMLWVRNQLDTGVDPRLFLSILGTDTTKIPDYMDDSTLWKVVFDMLTETRLRMRHKLRHVNTLDDVVRLLRGSKNIIVLTGAGVSVSCGIPDFRSRDGIYSRLAVDFPDLPNPQAMFDITYFSHDPRPFFKFAKDIYPGNFQPSPCHKFIKLLEKHNKLLRNYSQNIDTLEKLANIERVIECHGSFATASCTRCSYKVTANAIRDAINEQRIPLCPKCLEERGNVQLDEENYKELVMQGIMKPDIVFFGEGLPDHFHEAVASDKQNCDLLIVIGSSLKVRPVALIPSSLPDNVPQILINREPLPHCHFDVELLGDCDIIINQLCNLLGGSWNEGCWMDEPLKETTQLLPPPTKQTPSFCLSDNTQDNTVSSAQVSPKVDNESQLTEESTKPDQLCDSSSDNNKLCSGDFLHDGNNFMEGSQDTLCNDDMKEIKNMIKERHISVDSARDSGIGECSNLTDGLNKNEDSMKNLWEPKVKHSLAERLPKNMYYVVPPSRYIFPGAEVYYDPDEKYGYSDDDDDEDDDQEEEEEEEDDDEESSDSGKSETDSESEGGESKFGTDELDKFSNFVSCNKTE